MFSKLLKFLKQILKLLLMPFQKLFLVILGVSMVGDYRKASKQSKRIINGLIIGTCSLGIAWIILEIISVKLSPFRDILLTLARFVLFIFVGMITFLTILVIAGFILTLIVISRVDGYFEVWLIKIFIKTCSVKVLNTCR